MSTRLRSLRKGWRVRVVGAGLLVSLLGLVTVVGAERLVITPDGRVMNDKEGKMQPDLSPYRSKLPEVKILNRTFCFGEQLWAANEEFLWGMQGLNDEVRAAMPVAHQPAFIWLTNQQFYWGARYQLAFVIGTSHAGINMVQGPYWTMKALETANYTRLQRDRGEHIPSNKDIMLQFYMPMYWKITGWPRPPDDVQPLYLEFQCADPHFTQPVPVTDTFNDPISGKYGKWGQPEFTWNGRMFRWDRDKMEKVFDMGALGITLKRASMWIDYMWKSTHTGESPSTQAKKVVLKGNDAQEGFRGVALTFMQVNKALALKSELVADLEGHLDGVNPATYDPAQGLRYFPHKILPNMLLAGDMPERQWAFDIQDPRSLLYDQGALLWGLTHHYQNLYRIDVATENPPVDGGIVERQLQAVPHYLANMVLKNIQAMHTRNGLLVSEWQPPVSPVKRLLANYAGYTQRPGSGHTVQMRDLALTFIGLHEYLDRMLDSMAHVDNPTITNTEPVLTKQAATLLVANGDFLVKVQGQDGSFCESYNVETGAPAGPCDRSTPNFWAIRALSELYQAQHALAESGLALTEPQAQKYAEGARKAWNYVVAHYWHEPTGLFRSQLGSDTVRLTALDFAAQLGAWRMLFYTTPVHLIQPLIDPFTRYTVQTLMMAGMQQAEFFEAGELTYGVGSSDFDNDGVPWGGAQDSGIGPFGISPLLAREVAVNLGAPGQNPAFTALKGERHWAEKFGGNIEYRYQPLPQAEAVRQLQLPVHLAIPRDAEGNPVAEYDPDGHVIGGWVARPPLARWDGITITMPPAKPFKRGSALPGQKIFEMNCAHCHGYSGEGHDGIPFDSDALARTRDDMFEVPKNGRFTRLMPEWGLGLQDELKATLTDEELYRIVDYIQSPYFKRRFVDAQNGIHRPDVPPKDVYFYLGRAYLHGKQTPATQADLALAMSAQLEAIRTGQPVNVIHRLIEAERSRAARTAALSQVPVLGTIVSWFRPSVEAQEEQAELQKLHRLMAGTSFPLDLYAKVFSFTPEEMVAYARQPLAFPQATAVAVQGHCVSWGDVEHRCLAVQPATGLVRVAQAFEPSFYPKVFSYDLTNGEGSQREGPKAAWPYHQETRALTKEESLKIREKDPNAQVAGPAAGPAIQPSQSDVGNAGAGSPNVGEEGPHF